MKTFAFIALFALAATAAHARTPIPFSDAGQDGMVFYVPDASADAAAIAAALDHIATVHARHLTIPMLGCQTDATSSDVHDCRGYPDQAVAVARQAKARGYGVSFLPLLLSETDGKWRGYFAPKDPAAWFKAYTKWVLALAAHSSQVGASELIVASEMSQLYGQTDQWKAVLAAVRAVFAGPLVMTVNWNALEQGFWDDADAIGVSAYFPLSKGVSPQQAELDASWAAVRDKLVAFSRARARPLHVTEVGYLSVDTAAQQPWDFTSVSTPDSGTQARCFAAFSKAWLSDAQAGQTLVRANVWATGDLHDADYATSYDPIGKPAEPVLRAFFDARAGASPAAAVPAR